MSTLIIFNGLPASGKTTLAKLIADQLNLVLFSKDDFKELLGDKIGCENIESTKFYGKASFATLFLVAQRLLENDISCIIEGNFSHGEETTQFIEFLKSKNIRVFEILCETDGDILVKRFKSRQRHIVHNIFDQAQMKTYVETNIRNGKPTILGAGQLLKINTNSPIKICKRSILDFLDIG